MTLQTIARGGKALDQVHGKAQENTFKFYDANKKFIDKAINNKAKQNATPINLEDAVKKVQSLYILELHFLSFQLLLLKQARRALKDILTSPGSHVFHHGQIIQLFNSLSDAAMAGGEYHLEQFSGLVPLVDEERYSHPYLVAFMTGMLQNYLKDYKEVFTSLYKKETNPHARLPLWIQKLIQKLEEFLEMLKHIVPVSTKQLPAKTTETDSQNINPEQISRESFRRAYHALMGLDKSLQTIVKAYSISPHIHLIDLIQDLTKSKVGPQDATVSDVQERS